MDKSKLAYVILAAGAILGLGAFVSSPSSPYTGQLKSLQVQLAKVNDDVAKANNKKQSETSNVTVTNDDKGTVLAKAMSKSEDMMTDIYTWSDHKSYEANRTKLTADFTTDVNSANALMPEDKDNSGNSRVEALGVSSRYGGQTVFATSTDSPDVYILAQTTASQKNYGSEGANVNQLFKAHYDAPTQRFTTLQYLGKTSLQSSTGD